MNQHTNHVKIMLHEEVNPPLISFDGVVYEYEQAIESITVSRVLKYETDKSEEFKKKTKHDLEALIK